MVVFRSLMIAGLALLPSIAMADVAPDVDPYQACEGLALEAPCSVSTFDEFYDGTCVEETCPKDPGLKCKVCREAASATTGGSTGGPSGTGGTGGPDTSTTGSVPETTTTGTGGATGTATGGTSDGTTTAGSAATDTGSSSGDEPKDDSKGCNCRSSDASGGLLALLGLSLLRRRRRSA